MPIASVYAPTPLDGRVSPWEGGGVQEPDNPSGAGPSPPNSSQNSFTDQFQSQSERTGSFHHVSAFSGREGGIPSPPGTISPPENFHGFYEGGGSENTPREKIPCARGPEPIPGLEEGGNPPGGEFLEQLRS